MRAPYSFKRDFLILFQHTLKTRAIWDMSMALTTSWFLLVTIAKPISILINHEWPPLKMFDEKAVHFSMLEIIKIEFNVIPRQYLTWSRSMPKEVLFLYLKSNERNGKFFRYLPNFHNIFLMIRWFNKILHFAVNFCNFGGDEKETFLSFLPKYYQHLKPVKETTILQMGEIWKTQKITPEIFFFFRTEIHE